ncbi:hypothetical protein DRN67_04065 [Candidatus Micrarchaeota archaeon]|nr:MAG: hypothetical protein DRN67_04065 [Candidatus Micrarchaeota archaeon]
MFCLAGSEIRREGLKTNAGLTVSLKAWDAETKVGLNEPWYLFDEGPSCQTSYPGGNSSSGTFIQPLDELHTGSSRARDGNFPNFSQALRAKVHRFLEFSIGEHREKRTHIGFRWKPVRDGRWLV